MTATPRPFGSSAGGRILGNRTCLGEHWCRLGVGCFADTHDVPDEQGRHRASVAGLTDGSQVAYQGIQVAVQVLVARADLEQEQRQPGQWGQGAVQQGVGVDLGMAVTLRNYRE